MFGSRLKFMWPSSRLYVPQVYDIITCNFDLFYCARYVMFTLLPNLWPSVREFVSGFCESWWLWLLTCGQPVQPTWTFSVILFLSYKVCSVTRWQATFWSRFVTFCFRMLVAHDTSRSPHFCFNAGVIILPFTFLASYTQIGKFSINFGVYRLFYYREKRR